MQRSPYSLGNPMLAPISRRLIPAAALALSVISSSAVAQVTVRMTTAQSTNCVATTDGQGLQLVPGSTDLQATGVTLAGNGCGTSGADFQAALSVPQQVTVGSPATVTWSAGQPATLCTYGGTAGLSGWPVGTTACQGAQCATAHTVQVTPATAGNYNLSVTCTNDSGFKQGSLVAVGAPTRPQPDNFLLSATPAQPAVNVPFNVSWNVSGATSCTGTASLGGAPLATLTGWTATTPGTTVSRSVTASQAGTYTLKLVCENSVGSTSSQDLIVDVTDGSVGSCTSGTLTRAVRSDIVYPSGDGGSGQINNMPTRRAVDLTLFENIWGHFTSTDATKAWPGYSGSFPVMKTFGRNQFLAAKFHVPSGVASSASGQFTHANYFGGPALTMSISPNCGDFSAGSSACLVEGVVAGRTMISWKTIQQAGRCQLAPNTDYYLNVKLTDPAASDPNCTSSNCVFGAAVSLHNIAN